MTTDPFTCLGFEPRFDLAPEAIRLKAVRAAARLHPDRATDPVDASRRSQELSAMNEAAAELEDDEKRANALLNVLGGPSASEDRSLPDGFLEEMLEVRMDLESVIASGDEPGRIRLSEWAINQRAMYKAQVAELFGAPGDTIDEKVRANIRGQLNIWRYIERMIEQLNPEDHSGKEVPD